MNDAEKIGKIISEIKTDNPEGLSRGVVFAIRKQERFAAKVKAIIFGIASIVSISAFYEMVRMAASDFYSSGTSQMLSLIFSDFRSVMANFGDYFMSIAESFPVFPVIYTLLTLIVLGIFAGFAVNNMKKFQELKLNYLNHGYKHS